MTYDISVTQQNFASSILAGTEVKSAFIDTESETTSYKFEKGQIVQTITKNTLVYLTRKY